MANGTDDFGVKIICGQRFLNQPLWICESSMLVRQDSGEQHCRKDQRFLHEDALD